MGVVYRTILKHAAHGCLVVLFCLGSYTQAAVLDTKQYAYSHSLLLSGIHREAFVTGFRIPHDIAINSRSLRDLRIVDSHGNTVLTRIIEAPEVRKTLVLPVIDWWVGEHTALTAIDVRDISLEKIYIDTSSKGAGETVSVFGAREYYGIDHSPWDVVVRDMPLATGTTIVKLSGSPHYLLVAARNSKTQKPVSIKNIHRDNPLYADSLEQAYIRATIIKQGREATSTIAVIDTNSDALRHFAVDVSTALPGYKEFVTVETSTNNNTWTYRGTDLLAQGVDNRIEYSSTTDRFIRLILPGTGALGSQLIHIAFKPLYALFIANPGQSYSLYYGSQHPIPSEGSAAISNAASAAFFTNAPEAKVGIRIDNPSYIYARATSTEKTSINDILDSNPYSVPISLSIASLGILYFVFFVLRRFN